MTQQGDDCYFFYYSTCTKGDMCPFRHCEEALGSEVVCRLWQQGRCYRSLCYDRHMEIQKERSTIPCYWENQPGGCTKPHCAFQHYRSRKLTGDSVTIKSAPVTVITHKSSSVASGKTEASDDYLAQLVLLRSKQASVDSDKEIPSPKVEPVVVNPLEDESDQDSCNGSPKKKTGVVNRLSEVKLQGRKQKVISTKSRLDSVSKIDIGVKSLEDIRKEKLAAAKRLLEEANTLNLTSEMELDNVEELTNTGDLLQKDTDHDLIHLEEIQREKALRSLKKLHHSVIAAENRSSDQQAVTRRIVIADENEEDVVMKPRLTPGGVRVADRLGITRRGQQTNDEIKTNQRTVKSRLGPSTNNPDIKPTNPVGVKSRLGLHHSTDKTEEKESNHQDDSSQLTVKTLDQIRKEKLSRKRPITNSTDSTGGELKIKTLEELKREKLSKFQEKQTLPSKENKKIKVDEIENTSDNKVRKLKIVTKTDKSENQEAVKAGKEIEETNTEPLAFPDPLDSITIKSLAEIRKTKKPEIADSSSQEEPVLFVKTLEEIRKEKAAKQGQSENQIAGPQMKTDEKTSSTTATSSEENKSTRTIRRITLNEADKPGQKEARERPIRRRVQLYQPPPMKKEEAKAKIGQTSTASSSKEPAKVQRKPDWGIKTFTEIMKEKQQKKQEAQKDQASRSISPIVFQKDSKDTEDKPSTAELPVVKPSRQLLNPSQRRRTLSKRGVSPDRSNSSDSSSEDEVDSKTCIADTSESETPIVSSTTTTESCKIDISTTVPPQVEASVIDNITTSSSNGAHEAVTSLNVANDVITSTKEENTETSITSSNNEDIVTTEPSKTICEDRLGSPDPSDRVSNDRETEVVPAKEEKEREEETTPGKRKVSSSSPARSEERPIKVSRLDSTFDDDLDALLGDMSEDKDIDDDDKQGDDKDLLQEMEELLA